MTAAPKFTPGPWLIVAHELRSGFDLQWSYSIKQPAFPRGGPSAEGEQVCNAIRNRDDARLIAAAPELFAALSYLVARHLGEGTEQPSASAWDVGWQKARAALSKAAT